MHRRCGIAPTSICAAAATQREFQGWIEAYFIFVSPDETGRIETLVRARRRHRGSGRSRCSRSMPTCSGRRWPRSRPRSPTRKVTYDAGAGAAQEGGRLAEGVRRRGGGAAHRRSAAQLGPHPARPASRREPGRRQRRRRSTSASARWCRPAVRSCRCCRRAISGCASSCRRRCCRRCTSATGSPSAATAARGGLVARVTFISRAGRVHAARHLQPGGARAAGVPRRGHAGAAQLTARRPAGLDRPAASRARQPCPQAEASNGAIAVEVEGLTKSFGGKVVVRNLTMRVKRGQIYGFLGPNGSGKTTTIRMLCGLLTPDSGRGTALGYDIRTQSRGDQAARRLHDAALQPLPGPVDPGEPGVRGARLRPAPIRASEARGAIERLGLQGRERQLAGELSGGWKQRLALGACILPKPELLLLDEPTAGVDPKARREFWDEIHKLAAEGMTRARLHPLHGRGRALPRDRLHRLRRAAGARHDRGGDRPVAPAHLDGRRGPDLQALAEKLHGHCRHRHGGAVRRQPARRRRAMPAALDTARRAGFRDRAEPAVERCRSPRSRTCSSA